MNNTLEGKSVLITGAALRIGKEIALAYAAQGARVIIHYNRSESAAQELLAILNAKSKLSLEHAVVQMNLLDLDKCDAFIQDVVEKYSIDTLINNASTYHPCSFAQASKDTFRSDYELNFLVPHLLSRALYQYAKQGHIINLLDRRVVQVDPAAGMYGLAKKSLRDLTLACARDWAPSLRVNGVAPGCHFATTRPT